MMNKDDNPQAIKDKRLAEWESFKYQLDCMREEVSEDVNSKFKQGNPRSSKGTKPPPAA